MTPYIPEKLPLNLSSLNWEEVTTRVSEASAALAYYNGILKSIINPEIFLSPLETKEAVLSSRIEGTITTVDEVLKYEVDLKPESIHKQNDIIEVLNYRKATRSAKEWLKRELPFNLTMICAIQNELIQGTRGKDKHPGEIRKEQVWIGARNRPIEEASYVPPEPLGLKSAPRQTDRLYEPGGSGGIDPDGHHARSIRDHPPVSGRLWTHRPHSHSAVFVVQRSD